jgi:hypothetical protein
MENEDQGNTPAVDESAKHAIDALGEAISNAIRDADIHDVLALLTGAFVGITMEIVRREGHDDSKAIKLDGGPNRDITIHEAKV